MFSELHIHDMVNTHTHKQTKTPPNIKNTKNGVSGIAQQLKMCADKPDDWSLTAKVHMDEREK